MDKKYIVYMHKCPNGKVYIGATSQKLHERSYADGHGYKGNKLFWKDIQFYGWKNIEHIILFKNLDELEAYEKEIDLIKQHKSNNPNYGYNITGGGIGGDTWQLRSGHSEATKEKIRQSHLGQKRKPFKRIPPTAETKAKRRATILERGSMSGENNPNYGKITPPEVREKIRQGNIAFRKRKRELNDK